MNNNYEIAKKKMKLEFDTVRAVIGHKEKELNQELDTALENKIKIIEDDISHITKDPKL